MSPKTGVTPQVSPLYTVELGVFCQINSSEISSRTIGDIIFPGSTVIITTMVHIIILSHNTFKLSPILGRFSHPVSGPDPDIGVGLCHAILALCTWCIQYDCIEYTLIELSVQSVCVLSCLYNEVCILNMNAQCIINTCLLYTSPSPRD